MIEAVCLIPDREVDILVDSVAAAGRLGRMRAPGAGLVELEYQFRRVRLIAEPWAGDLTERYSRAIASYRREWRC